LDADLARATRAERINILAPIPGKDTVGIEVANKDKVIVPIRELLEDDIFQNGKAKLPIALGKDVYGKTIIGDLAAMPHLLVAGATGSGKSVCINGIVTSLLCRFAPDELRFILIDPKVVEMQNYAELPHLALPVVTDPKKALLALRWVVKEMENRSQIFAQEACRNFETFNSRNRRKAEKVEADKLKAGKNGKAPAKKMAEVVIEEGVMRAVTLADGSTIESSRFIFGIGHSSRDTFTMLHRHGVPFEAKPFSIGVRIEHPQKLIDRTLYGKWAGDARLGSAPYKFVAHCGTGRAAYSFCMCPGGLVVAATSEPGMVVTNGMSSYAREEANANSGFMVDVRPEDMPAGDVLAGFEFQRSLERRAFVLGGGNYHAPAQLLGDLMAGRASTGALAAMSASSWGRWAATTSRGPSSSTMRTASQPGGYSAWTAALAASRASASMISIAPGSRPLAMMAETASPACSRVR
jgi:hypothetical protein